VRYADHLRSLIAYNQWANERILEAASALTDEQLVGDGEPSGASYDNILGTLNHSLWAQSLWLERWHGRSKLERFDLVREELWPRVIEADRQLQAFGQSLVDDDFGRTVEYQDTSGNHHSRTLGQLVTHVINHGTYHRGEAALMLTRLGRSPGDLDYVYFIPEDV
jgi:uncharacterized damage-inducible protein DinB